MYAECIRILSWRQARSVQLFTPAALLIQVWMAPRFSGLPGTDLWGQWWLLRLKKEWVAKKRVNGESKLWPLDFSASFNQKPFLFLAWERLWKSRPGHCWILCGGFLVRCTLQPLMSQPLAAQWCDNLWICLKIGSFIPSKLAISFPIKMGIQWYKLM